jgi:two-component system OmpR family response regulator
MARGSVSAFGEWVSTPTGTVLIVDDDVALAAGVARTMGDAGLVVRTAASCGEARSVLRDWSPDVAVVAMTLPDGSGIALCEELRRSLPDVGVVFLAGRHSLHDRLLGFAAGADDCVAKPFNAVELTARVGAVRRRSSRGFPDVLEVGDIALRDRSHEVARAGVPLDLTPTEYRLLRLLMRNRGIVVSKEQIYAQVWGYGHIGDDGLVEKFISQLRAKVDRGRTPTIHTVREFGYVMR